MFYRSKWSPLAAVAAALLWAGSAAAGVGIPDPDVSWLFDEGEGDMVGDSIGEVHGTASGDYAWGNGTMIFDGVSAGVKFPDSPLINTTGPFMNRTVVAIFKPTDANNSETKQVIFDEGGRTRGAVIYVFDGHVYAAAWNRAEYQWAGEFPMAPVRNNQWHAAAFVIRDAINAVEDGRFEMWADGELVASLPGGQLFAHGDDTGVGHTNQNTVFHDDDGTGTNRDYFAGEIDEISVWNVALLPEALMQRATSVDPAGKLALQWGSLKSDR